MNIPLVCLLLLTVIFGAAGICLLALLHSARKTLQNLDGAIKTVNETADQARQVAVQAETTFTLINDRLPAMLEDIADTAANARTISEDAHTQLGQSVVALNDSSKTLAAAANLGNYVLKGYSALRWLKKIHPRV
jgi:uncharacterized protein YoxC